LPGPGARTFWAKSMRQLLFHRPGGLTVRTSDGKYSLWVGATGRSPIQPAPFCGGRSEPPRRGPTQPMLFAQKVLAPGPRPKHSGNVNPSTGNPVFAEEPREMLFLFGKMRQILPIPFLFQVLLGNKAEGCRVQAVTKAGGGRSVRENMAQV